jgi:hypothetical protein
MAVGGSRANTREARQRLLRRPVRGDSRRSESRERGDTEPRELTHSGSDPGGEEDAREADSVAGSAARRGYVSQEAFVLASFLLGQQR